MTQELMSSKPARIEPFTRATLPTGLWSGDITFRHGQCDPASIVYTPKFFDVFNQVIEQWFGDDIGVSYYDLLGPRRIGLGYVSTGATFFETCKMGECIEIFIDVTHVGTKSYSLTLYAIKGDKEVLRGTFTTVTTDLKTHQAIAIPEDVKAGLLRIRERKGC